MRQLQRTRTGASRRRSHEGASQPLAPLPAAVRDGRAEAALLLERISALLDEREQHDA